MAPFPYAVAMGGQGGRLRRLWGRVTVAAVIVAPVFVAVGATSAVADNAATGGVSSVVVFDDAASPADALAPVVEDSVAASPRSRFVDIDSEVLLTELADDDVTFELFDDVTVVFGDLGELTVGADGNETWSATAATATGTLSFAADGVRGSIQSGATTYSIVPVDGATHLLFEEGRSFPPTEEPLVPPAEPTWANDAPAAPGSIGEFTAPPSAGDGAPVVRVLTVFDDLSSAYYGGDGNAVAELTATIDEVNAAYARSGVNLVMQSAAIERVGYASSQAAGAELTRITNPGDGILDGVNQRRDALGADLVVLVTPLGLTVGGASCGQAWLPQGSASDPAFGFAVVDPVCARGNLTFAHETGHNLGADHGPSGGRLGYNNGYINLAGGYRTIMAYPAVGCAAPCTRVPFFSNPAVQYNGQPTGSDTQNNARVLNEFGPYVAAYRSGGVPAPLVCGPAAGTTLVSLSPARLLDSRIGGATVDGQLAGIGQRPTGSVTEVQVAGRGCVPTDATAVVLNVTVVQARVGGYASVFPCGEAVPNASNLNFAAGQTVPNAVVAKVGAGGKVCVFAEVPFDLLVDVNGYVPAGSSVGSLSPARLLDSRAGGATVDGQLAGIGQRSTGSITEVPVAGTWRRAGRCVGGGVERDRCPGPCGWVRDGVPVWGGGAECVEPELRGGPDGAECGGGQGGCGRQGVCVRRGAVRSVGRRERVCAGGFGGRVVEPGASARFARRWCNRRRSTGQYRPARCRFDHRGSGCRTWGCPRQRHRRRVERDRGAGCDGRLCLGVPVW